MQYGRTAFASLFPAGRRWLATPASPVSVLPCTIYLVLVLVLAPVLPAGAGEATYRDGVLHVVNGAEPGEGREVVELEEVWRAGGEYGEDIFGMISQVRVADDGTIYLLDTQLAEVPVFSSDGERLDTLSRQGEGPGETRLPSNLIFMPDGTLGICQIFPGKITRITREGTPAGDVMIGGGDPTRGGFLQLFDCIASGDHLIVTGEAISQNGGTGQTRVNFVAACDLEGDETVRYWEKSRELDFARFVYDEDAIGRVDYRKVAVGADGRVYLACERNAYRIHVFAPDGSLERIIERVYEHRARDSEDARRLREAIMAQLQQLPDPKVEVSETEPDIAALRFGSDGNLWVDTSRGGYEQPEGVFYTWDVFTPDGHFLKQVAAVCAGDGDDDYLIWTPRGDAVQVTGFTDAVRSLQGGGAADDEDAEAAPMEVVYYRRAES
jgi:hypothetical protein